METAAQWKLYKVIDERRWRIGREKGKSAASQVVQSQASHRYHPSKVRKVARHPPATALLQHELDVPAALKKVPAYVFNRNRVLIDFRLAMLARLPVTLVPSRFKETNESIGPSRPMSPVRPE